MRRVWRKLEEKGILKPLGILFVFCLFVWYNMMITATMEMSSLRMYLDIPTLVSMVFFAAAVLWLGGMGGDFLNGFRLAFTKRNDYSRIKLQKACHAVKYARTLIFLEAAVEILVGLIYLLNIVYGRADRTALLAAAIILLSMLYASMIAVLLTIFIAKLENMLTSYMEEPQQDLSVDEAQTIYFKLRAMGLTDREAEVARLVSCEMTNREIGQMLFISETTVKKHVTHILEKVALTDRGELTKMIRAL